jgi:prophage regulatory protein
MLATNQRLIRLRTVREKTGLSKSTLYALAQQGRFPRPVKLSERCSAWDEREVDLWIAEKVGARAARSSVP